MNNLGVIKYTRKYMLASTSSYSFFLTRGHKMGEKNLKSSVFSL